MLKIISCILIGAQLLLPLSLLSQDRDQDRRIPAPRVVFIPDEIAIPITKKEDAENVINKLDGLYKETDLAKDGKTEEQKQLIDAELERLKELLALMLLMMSKDSEETPSEELNGLTEKIIEKSAPLPQFEAQFPKESDNNFQVGLAAVGVLLVAFQPQLAPFIMPAITAIMLSNSTSTQKIEAVRAMAESVASGKVSVQSRGSMQAAGVKPEILAQFVDANGNFTEKAKSWEQSGDTFKSILATALNPKMGGGDEIALFEALIKENFGYIRHKNFLTETDVYAKASKLLLNEERRKILQEAEKNAAANNQRGNR